MSNSTVFVPPKCRPFQNQKKTSKCTQMIIHIILLRIDFNKTQITHTHSQLFKNCENRETEKIATNKYFKIKKNIVEFHLNFSHKSICMFIFRN